MLSTKRVWEVMVPVSDSAGQMFTVAYHRIWDENVCKLAGGLTIYSTVSGRWRHGDFGLIAEKMIPVRIACTDEQIDCVLAFTSSYYQQEEVMAWVISDRVHIWRKPTGV